jgi:DNA invertase Pin-like site-specific DNA recombinase
VLVWRYDRFARSTQAPVNALMEFRALGVDFISFQENVDTTTPQGELVFGLMASLAQFGSALIGERVRAGMARGPGAGPAHLAAADPGADAAADRGAPSGREVDQRHRQGAQGRPRH